MNMKKFKYIGVMITAAMAIGAVSCSDFDDYNTVKNDGGSAAATAGQTLWENISSDSQLSDFASIIKKVGFDDELNSATFYTVWAPLNGTYDAASLLASDDETVLKQFVKNHIASYNYPATGTIDERIHTLNLKSYDFTGSGAYTYAGIGLAQANIPSSNGVMHTLNGYAAFYPNIYEYFSLGEDIDSVGAFVNHYEITELDEESSIIGPVVNGRQTYIDSVMVTSNTLISQLGARISNEDSSYTAVIPNNEAWIEAYNRIKPYYKYATTTNCQQLADNDTKISTVTATVDPVYMQDSMTKRKLVEYMFFSNNDDYNKWIENPSAVNNDTIRTTRRAKLSQPDRILDRIVNKVTMSNGYACIVDSLAHFSWETYAPELTISATRNEARVLRGSVKNTYVNDPDQSMVDTKGYSMSYLLVEPNSASALPELDIYLPEVLSTEYNLYCVVVPADVSLSDTISEVKPTSLKFELSYATASGAIASKVLGTYENDTAKVDTMYIGNFTFPVAYKGLGDGYQPNIKMTIPYTMFNKTAMNTYTRQLRIAAIILRPVEYDAYLGKEE